MNDHPDLPSEQDDDAMLEEMLSQLKRLEPPLEARIANRMAVAAALRSLNTVNRQRALPWWRRSVSIPLPIAASVAALVVIALLSSLLGGREQLPLHVAAPEHSEGDVAPTPIDPARIARRAPETLGELKHSVSETYMCGVGRVNSESRYSFKE